MTDVRAAIAAERTELAATLAGLTEQQWDTPTLCAGWRVREVVAHMTKPFRETATWFSDEAPSIEEINRAADHDARLDAQHMTSSQLQASLADNVDHPWQPGSFEGALSHDVIHGLDITVALDLGRQVPLERLRIVLDGLQPGNIAFFGADLSGIELRADDIDWSYGTGTPLSGNAQDLLLVLCGRTVPEGWLSGDLADRGN